MKLRRRFFAFALLIHVALLVLSVLLLNQSKYLFFAAELFILFSIGVTVHLYRAFLKPLDLLASGIESIKDRDFSTTFVKTGHDELDRLIDVYNRMIEQLRSERVKQREQHYFLERLIEATPIGVVILDLDERISMLNPAAREILGVEADKALGCTLERIISQPWSCLADMRPGETRVIRVSGIETYRSRKSHFLDRGFHRHFLLIEELTGEILASQKYAYERVIRMMSHEVNNSVGAVNSILASSLGYKDQLTSGDRDDFEHAIRVAIERNQGLNRFMTNFAEVVRIPPPAREPYGLHKLLRSVHVLMSAECARRRISWQWELCPGELEVEIDVHQMEQVLVNIAKNAIEAVGSDGAVIVRTSDTPPVLRLIDNGGGIDPGERSYLFTPFYSTKRNGQGIGLTLVREILVNHGFSFDLTTSDAQLTEFCIRFDSQRCPV